MKKLKTLLIFTSTICLIFSNAQEEEIKTVTRNGVEYKINPNSGHQTLLNPNNEEQKWTEQSDESYNVSFHIGQISPFGENLRNSYNPGYSLGFTMTAPKTFNFLNKDWNLHGIMSFSKLSANNNDSDKANINMLNFGSTLSTEFGPVLINAGLALTPFMSSYHDMDDDVEKNDNEIFISIIGNIGYKVSQNSNFDIILNLNFQEILGSAKQADGSRGTSEVYGLNVVIGKGLNF